MLFLHFCSGPRRDGDLCDAVEQVAREAGLVARAVARDPAVDRGRDLASLPLVSELRSLCSSGDAMASFAGRRARQSAGPGTARYPAGLGRRAPSPTVLNRFQDRGAASGDSVPGARA